MAAADNYVL